jgi:tetratricopeptide (TPR) repeat protein
MGGGGGHVAGPSFSSGGHSFSEGGHSFNEGAHSFNNAHWNNGENFAHGWNGNGNLNGRGNNWYGYNNGWNQGGFGWGIGPYWWPAWGLGYGYPYSDYYYDQPDYQTGYAPDTVAPQQAPVAAATNEQSSNIGGEFFGQAETAFSSGNYHDALRYANHAAVESPQNPKAHELMSLSLMALGDYRGAALEAHAALTLGPPSDWSELYSYYGNEGTYTTQLRALEKYSQDNRTSPEGHFLRAYQYLMMGHKDAFKGQMEQASKLAPKDKLAAELLKKFSENSAPTSTPSLPTGAQENPTPTTTGSLTGVDS